MLETSILNWIKSMGIIYKLGKENADNIDNLIEL